MKRNDGAVRIYRGCLIYRTFPSGYWRTTSLELPLMADTLAGLKAMIRDAQTGALVIGPNGWKMADQ